MATHGFSRHLPHLLPKHLGLHEPPSRAPHLAWKLMLGAVGGAAVVAGLASSAAQKEFRQRYEAQRSDLLRWAMVAPPGALDPGRLAELPAPVRRYVEVTHAATLPPWRVAELRQRGTLRSAPDGRWMPFEAEQTYSLDPPAFVWFADARAMPGVRLLALDESIDGRGSMSVSLMGAVSLADAKGPRMDLGAGLRLWGELIAFPEVVTDPHLRWEAIDEKRAGLHIDQPPLRLSAEVEFDAEGRPAAMHADRYRSVGDSEVLTPWSGRMGGWRELNGRPFPTEWSSVWHLEEGDFEAVRIEVLSVRTW